ncbi:MULTISPECIES: ATP-binding protein [Stenotrophomonas]|jgi:PAS domain S-box-containing protein|uniref:histidine kinase n=1 Tax=Stenotrophomonas acidaminiphila TaxID=128780 RepID=A0A0R0DT16_9GAMM|nr:MULTISPECIES: ATP-binding protein [Stenotrophomonas]OZB52533.1 MAG: histidine kinase [Stenotrophomonas sp. 14-69-23]ALJ27142.1 two-component sensor histidine kinase [Stenotrophomonas acidaminiphila]KRG85273.1 histidine kinase [Stenotrophomonas acidaminiphila]MCA7025197.1 PAS domain-containing protein [Stenotrophomonas acidaminiphila]MCE4075572.1 ATP-binding protein [Stenotrophomonas acidaminiphila]
MAYRFTDEGWDRWRFAGLALAALLIVVVPSLLLLQLSRDSVNAANWVAHTQAVSARLYVLQADIRDVESAALTMSKGVESDALRQRLRRADYIGQTLGELSNLVSDSPEQLVRIGRITSMLERRMALAKQIADSVDSPRQRQLIEEMTFSYPIRDIVVELQHHEEQLLTKRVAAAQRQQRLSTLVTWSTLAAQLLLLGLVLWLLKRQIGRRNRAEQRLLQASARAGAVLQTVREPIVLLNAEQRIVLHNAAFAELYGVQGRDANGQPLQSVGEGAWADPIIHQRLADVLLRGRELWDYEHEQRGVDGLVRIMLVNARRMPLPDSDDEVVLMTVSDVTLQRAVQLRVEELNRQLEGKIEQMAEVNRELEAFSYSVSHDLRAPLRHVAGFSDKLARHLGEDADERSRHYLQVIGDSARRMAALIDDLLVYSRLGRGAMRLQPVDMQSLVADTRALLDSNLRAEAGADGTVRDVQWNIGPLPVLVADENMMRQVWLNLLGNAVKYTAGREHALIEISAQQLPDGGHQFTVRDNGTGFDMQYAGKLFGVFQRLHKASDYPGTGIGLASVRRVLTRHGGRIWAEAQVDQGATFHFILPPPAPDAHS